jgi:predicted MFS family arabinose efflux permease
VHERRLADLRLQPRHLLLALLRALVLVQILTAAGIFAVIFLPPMAAYVLLPAIGAVLQGSSSITYGSVSEMFHPDRQARGFSLIYTSGNVAAVAGSVLLGAISDWIGLSAMMLTITALTLLTLPLVPLLRSGLQAEP